LAKENVRFERGGQKFGKAIGEIFSKRRPRRRSKAKPPGDYTPKDMPEAKNFRKRRQGRGGAKRVHERVESNLRGGGGAGEDYPGE